MRNNLVNKFICKECGNQLNVSYDIPERHKNESDGITGADKVEIFICVEPCVACLAPSREILKAIEVLRGCKND